MLDDGCECFLFALVPCPAGAQREAEADRQLAPRRKRRASGTFTCRPKSAEVRSRIAVFVAGSKASLASQSRSAKYLSRCAIASPAESPTPLPIGLLILRDVRRQISGTAIVKEFPQDGGSDPPGYTTNQRPQASGMGITTCPATTARPTINRPLNPPDMRRRPAQCVLERIHGPMGSGPPARIHGRPGSTVSKRWRVIPDVPFRHRPLQPTNDALRLAPELDILEHYVARPRQGEAHLPWPRH